MSLPSWLALEANGAEARPARAKNVIVLIEHGGMSHVDTWDPKPDAASEHRSPFALVPTRTPGVQFTELLRKTALISDRLAVVRGMRHITRVDDHPRGMQYMLSGEAPGGPIEMPDMGSMVAYLMGSNCKYLPPYIQLPATSEMADFTRTGFLPPGNAVFKVKAADCSDPAWKVPGLSLQSTLSEERVHERRDLLAALNSDHLLTATRPASALDTFYEQAANILLSPAAAKVFDLTQETPQVREQYGEGHRGSCYLLGRRMIEAGVRFVTIDVRWPTSKKTPMAGNLNWDHHDHIYAKETCMLPGAGGGGAGRYGIGHWVMTGSLDQAFSTLIVDLEQRGLLDETLVCLVTEFGRTPKLNKHQGRDHWPDAYSIVFAGAGIQGGQIIGETDRQGAFVRADPRSPEDYAATIYDFLGIDREQPVYTPERRPMFLAHKGKSIFEVG
ncbi:MAG TPA: DUF1501 domain-containing protein [Pirellulaceae bacterium]|nr:DUF1501 domain-containing protein [Pirellulaceae bacterium]